MTDRGSPSSATPPTTTPPSATPPDGSGLVLTARLSGGLAPPPATKLPDFSLYADGRLFTPGNRDGNLPTVDEHRLSAQQTKQLIDQAAAAGLRHAHRVDRNDVADATVAELTFYGAHTTITMPEQSNDPAARFWMRLKATRLPAPAPYQPEKLAVVPIGNGAGTGRSWPLGALKTPCTIYSGKKLATAEKAARTAPPGTQWTVGHQLYNLSFRPLLPGEQGCPAMR